MKAGHLLSKMRFVSAQLLAYLEDELKPSESKEIGQKIAASPVAT